MAGELTPDEMRRRLGDLNALMVRDLVAFWRKYEGVDADRFRRLLLEAYPELVSSYRQIAADEAAAWYESLEPQSSFRAVTASEASVEQFQASVRWALSRKAALESLVGSAKRAVFDGARRTVMTNMAREPGAKWARESTGKTCAFCAMLIGRGAVYSENTAGFQSHDHCQCVAVPVRPGGLYVPPGYVAEWEQLYARAAAETDGSKNAVLAHMREHGDFHDSPKSVLPERRGVEGFGTSIVASDGTVLPYHRGDEIKLSRKGRRHILYGSPDKVWSGGHLHGVGRPYKTEFPAGWDPERILTSIQRVIDEAPSSAIEYVSRTRSTVIEHEIDGVLMRVVLSGSKMQLITGHPIEGDGVFQNIDGKPAARPLGWAKANPKEAVRVQEATAQYTAEQQEKYTQKKRGG